jgi:hypothetical protein
MYPHRIRLRGPWEFEQVSSNSAPVRTVLPLRWGQNGTEGCTGRVRLRRRFGYPGRIDSHEAVWLTIGSPAQSMLVALNGAPLAGPNAGPWEFDITGSLRERNEVNIELEIGESGTAWGDVSLEVRCTAFLREVNFDLALTPDGSAQLVANGELCGQSEDALELYLLLDRSNVAYASLPGPVRKQRFRLESEPMSLDLAKHQVQLDLVRGASIWYTLAQELKSQPPHTLRG